MLKLFKNSHRKENLYRLLFKAFSNKTRLKIIQTLRKNSLTVTEICEKTKFKQSSVSRNLKCLENCGFVSIKKEGNFSKYSLNKETIFPVLKLFDKHTQKYKEKLKNCLN